MKRMNLKERSRSNRLWWVGLLRLPLTSLFLFCGDIGNSLSETVYRCGNSYSSSSQCAQETATEVNAYSEPPHHTSTPNAIAAKEQREADALEKKRLHDERQATQKLPARMVVVPAEKQTATPPTPQNGKKLPRSPSPYFTANDPNKPMKQTPKD